MADTYISEAMKQAVGSESARSTSYPISESDIRKWALAVYWPQLPPAYFTDADAAAASTYGGIVAPEDFNPFAWGAAKHELLLPSATTSQDMGHADGIEASLGISGPGLKFIQNGGMNCEYGVRMRPGDVIVSTNALGEYSEREGRLGRMLFSRSISTWVNQNGETVKKLTMTVIRY